MLVVLLGIVILAHQYIIALIMERFQVVVAVLWERLQALVQVRQIKLLFPIVFGEKI